MLVHFLSIFPIMGEVRGSFLHAQQIGKAIMAETADEISKNTIKNKNKISIFSMCPPLSLL